MFSNEFCKISKNTFFQRTPLVAASEISILGSMISGKAALDDIEGNYILRNKPTVIKIHEGLEIHALKD